MTTGNRLQAETHLLETLISGLDARESARRAGSPMLVHLAEMLVEHARDELGRPEPIPPGDDGGQTAGTGPFCT